jgi:hypothetical protein
MAARGIAYCPAGPEEPELPGKPRRDGNPPVNQDDGKGARAALRLRPDGHSGAARSAELRNDGLKCWGA